MEDTRNPKKSFNIQPNKTTKYRVPIVKTEAPPYFSRGRNRPHMASFMKMMVCKRSVFNVQNIILWFISVRVRQSQ